MNPENKKSFGHCPLHQVQTIDTGTGTTVNVYTKVCIATNHFHWQASDRMRLIPPSASLILPSLRISSRYFFSRSTAIALFFSSVPCGSFRVASDAGRFSYYIWKRFICCDSRPRSRSFSGASSSLSSSPTRTNMVTDFDDQDALAYSAYVSASVDLSNPHVSEWGLLTRTSCLRLPICIYSTYIECRSAP